MARTVRDASLETRAARGRLKSRGKPYYRAIEPGLHLGYRKPFSGAGKWVVRHYAGGQTYTIETIATADDFSDADGVAALSFQQAQAAARKRMVDRAHSNIAGPVTVAEAMDAYLEFLEAHRRTGRDAAYRDRAFIRPTLGPIEISALTSQKVRGWLADLAKAPARLRTREGEKQKHQAAARDADGKRRRQASANRTLTVLKAALNRAWRDGRVPSDAMWRRVEPFENVGAARVRYLSIAEAQRLLNACDAEFRPLVQAALQTGARYGELTALQVRDFNGDAGTVAVTQSKAGKPRHVALTEEGVAFFRRACAGRAGGELMFIKSDGGAWLKSHQARPMVDACHRAKITPAVGFHTLRHTWASLAVMAGVPLLVVAKNLGHSDTRMVEKHYGHLAPSYIVDAIRAGAPRFGAIKADSVVPIGRTKQN